MTWKWWIGFPILEMSLVRQEVVIARMRSGWKKFKISGLLCKRGLSLKIKGSMYKKYVRSALSYLVKVPSAGQ